MGQIVHLHYGLDGISRVERIQVANKEYTRTLGKLVKLPVHTKTKAYLIQLCQVMASGSAL